MKTSLFLKSAAVLLTALALGVFLFTRVRVNAEAAAPTYDLLITNARIVDGSGNPSMTNCEPMNQLMIHPVRIIHRGEA